MLLFLVSQLIFLFILFLL